jgi:hypothetical protein
MDCIDDHVVSQVDAYVFDQYLDSSVQNFPKY